MANKIRTDLFRSDSFDRTSSSYKRWRFYDSFRNVVLIVVEIAVWYACEFSSVHLFAKLKGESSAFSLK